MAKEAVTAAEATPLGSAPGQRRPCGQRIDEEYRSAGENPPPETKGEGRAGAEGALAKGPPPALGSGPLARDGR